MSQYSEVSLGEAEVKRSTDKASKLFPGLFGSANSIELKQTEVGLDSEASCSVSAGSPQSQDESDELSAMIESDPDELLCSIENPTTVISVDLNCNKPVKQVFKVAIGPRGERLQAMKQTKRKFIRNSLGTNVNTDTEQTAKDDTGAIVDCVSSETVGVFDPFAVCPIQSKVLTKNQMKSRIKVPQTPG